VGFILNMLILQLGAVTMEKTIEVVGNISGVLGVLSCLVSGLFRLFGYYTFFDKILLESMFILGIGLMVFACMAKLHLLSSRK
jgi:type IV secretory pathway VirB2 component (pilin)